MNRKGFWVRTAIDRSYVTVVYASDDYHDEMWDNDKKEWVDLEEPVTDLGSNDDWEKVTEEEALSVLGLEAWE